jgi:hypothetical protein
MSDASILGWRRWSRFGGVSRAVAQIKQLIEFAHERPQHHQQ